MKTPHQQNQSDDCFRQTGKFNPIQDSSHQILSHHSRSFFRAKLMSTVFSFSSIKVDKHHQEQSKWWRLYFSETLSAVDKQAAVRKIERCFEVILKNNQLAENKTSEIFMNINGILIERVRSEEDEYFISNLDFNCVVVYLLAEKKKERTDYGLQCHWVELAKRVREQSQYTQQIHIKMKDELSLYYLIFKNQGFSLVKDKAKRYPFLQLTEQNFEESVADIPKSMLIIKNLSLRVISIKFLEQSCIRSTDPLQIVVGDSLLLQSLLYKINRIKYQKNKGEVFSQQQERGSFDFKTKTLNRQQSKTTPEKLVKVGSGQIQSPTLNKAVNQPPAGVQGQHQRHPKYSKAFMQGKGLKISQRVAANPKQSNLTASELQYPVSVQDQKQVESQYYDDFENLLYQEGREEKQLSLNDSFEQFQKKENSVKNLELMAELSKRKEKELEEKSKLNTYKDRLLQLMGEEKEWIDRNLKLKVEIKKMQKNQANSQQAKEIDEIKAKISQLKKMEKVLIDELSSVKDENNIEVLVFGEKSPESSESQRQNKEKIVFHSINGFSPSKINQPQFLAASVRSSKNDYLLKFPKDLSPDISLKSGARPRYFKTSGLPESDFNSSPNVGSELKQQFVQPQIYSSVPATKSFIDGYQDRNYTNPNTKSNVQENLGFPAYGSKFMPKSPVIQPNLMVQPVSSFQLSPQGSQKRIIVNFSSASKT